MWVFTDAVCCLGQASCCPLFVGFWHCLGFHRGSSCVFMVVTFGPDCCVPPYYYSGVATAAMRVRYTLAQITTLYKVPLYNPCNETYWCHG